MDPRIEAKELVENLDQRMGPSPYDTAWLARLRNPGTNTSRWPDLIEWLLNNQHPDGSWGGKITYYHDRVICTLAAIIALKEHGIGYQVEEPIARGARYIWHNLTRLRHDPMEAAGFELLFPSLLMEAQALDLNVPAHTCGYGRIREAKLRMIPPGMLYSPFSSVAYSLEFLGLHGGDSDRMHALVGQDGSVACSPAATAYYVRLTGDAGKALDYLQAMRALPGGIPAFHPFRTYEAAWVLKHLALGGLALLRRR